MKLTSYKECLEFLNSFGTTQTRIIYPEGHSQHRCVHVLELLNNPQNKFKSVHIGGTSGKTSTSSLIAQILSNSGYKTGLTTSPHLQVPTERIQINNKFISESDFCNLVARIGPLFTRLHNDPQWGTPGYFEMFTILAFAYFAAQKVDIAVIEVGIGGKFDCTNVITPEISAITNVGLDHTNILGETLEDIAKDKREIVKPGKPVFTTETQELVLQLIKEKAESVDSEFIQVSVNNTENYQSLNTALALAVCKKLNKIGYNVYLGDAWITKNNFKMAGRLEIVSQDPLVILDGAHNREKMQATVKSLQKSYKQKFAVVYKTLNPIHSANMFRELLPIADTFYITDHDLPYFPITNHYQLFTTLLDAFSFAKSSGFPILVTGSLYTVGEIRNLYYPPEEMVKQQTYYPK